MKRFISFGDLMRRRDLLMAALLVSLGLDVILGVVVGVKALERRSVLVLPTGSIETPGEISDDAARAFCRLYLVTFDTYTPSTLPTATDWLKKRISPKAWSQANEGLDRRLSVVREGRMSSLVMPLDDGTVDRREGVAVTIKARRTVYIADHLSRETTATYRFEIESIAATPAHPEGLGVVRQNVEEEHEAAH